MTDEARELVKRLRETARTIGRGEPLMSIPARPDHDGDLICMEAAAFIERTAAAGRVTPDIARGNVESMRRQVDGWTAPRVCIEFVDDAELTAFLKARSAALTHTGDQE